jgi:hypothetical protein
MLPNHTQLAEMSELNLIAAYNSSAKSTAATPAFWLSELQRRRFEDLAKQQNDQADRMEAQGQRMERLTRLMFRLTVINVALVAVALVPSIYSMFA